MEILSQWTTLSSTKFSAASSAPSSAFRLSTSRSAQYFSPIDPLKPGYEIAVPEHPAEGNQPAQPQTEEAIQTLLASADVSHGEEAANKCMTCHTFEKAEPNGPAPICGASSNAAGFRAGLQLFRSDEKSTR